MFQRIMAPVDLGHLETLDRALHVTGQEAKQRNIPVVYVSVTTNTPTRLAHTPEEFGRKLDAFAAEQAAAHGIETSAHTIISHDPTVDTDRMLMRAAGDLGADLIVMATHKPGLREYFFHSHGGDVASHAPVSVLLVRDA